MVKIKATKKGMAVSFEGGSVVFPKDFGSLKEAVARAISEETGTKINDANANR